MKGVILKCDTCQKNIEAESTQKEDSEVEWGPCAPLYIRGKEWCYDLFGECACARVCVCVCVLQKEIGACVLQTKSPLRVVSASPKAQCRERRRARRSSCGYASSPSPRGCMRA